MSQKTSDPKQVNQYDKIIRENLDVILPDLLEDLLHINAARSEEFRDNIQHTKEREIIFVRKGFTSVMILLLFRKSTIAYCSDLKNPK